ncbi:MAG: hypothetical protein RMX96_24490 [Nostoc sp. ChiSLP02]|nr:hypothetical protein [Nostoc sp. DedSLP05]MDZ8097920.1 hypothetical protein [Nostoc sp. DedSLP01]MDZ8187997.1 hypothetical protein [Nostoc sp. ChiSLP02]
MLKESLPLLINTDYRSQGRKGTKRSLLNSLLLTKIGSFIELSPPSKEGQLLLFT